MVSLQSRLLKNKFLILVLFIALLAFASLYIAETYFSIAPRMAEIIRAFAMALLTSGVVGFVFEYQTRKEFTEVVQLTVHNEIQGLESKLAGKVDENENLFSFWRPFITEGTSIVIAQDESGVEPMVRTADISAALHLHSMLIRLFSLPDEVANVEIEFISKSITGQSLCSHKKHIIVVGAPGASPLATAVLNKFHGAVSKENLVKNGYVFSVDASRPQKYLGNPYILPEDQGLTPGILEIKNGKIERRYERYHSPHLDGVGRDSCLVEYGVISCEQDRLQNVLLVAGHSRFSTLDGVNFVLTNEDWARAVKDLNGKPAATILETSISMAHGRVTKIAKTPHII